MARIVGVVLIKNEDLYISWVLQNILDFCDSIIVLDNLSTDHTWEIVERFARETGKIDLRKWSYAKDSQTVLVPYYGTDTWVFGVDGDEVFDPIGLASLRKRLMAGEFDHVWNLRGNFLNCVSVCLEAPTADGYLAPPAREGAKLFNFKFVRGWSKDGRHERLHGYPVFSDEPVIRRHFLGNSMSWEESYLRCLHLCFMERSTTDRRSIKSLATRWTNFARGMLLKSSRVGLKARPGPASSVKYKIENYAVGDLVTRDISDFMISNATVYSSRHSAACTSLLRSRTTAESMRRTP